jgi:hypothetical protein
MANELGDYRYFISYSGVRLPLQLVNELHGGDLDNRNTYFRGIFDADQHLLLLEKVVYGEVELCHRYRYHATGGLCDVEITDADAELTWLRFDVLGKAI